MKPPELKFRARFVIVVGKRVSYVDVPTTNLDGALAKIKKYNKHDGCTCAMAEEWVNGHWTLRARKPSRTT